MLTLAERCKDLQVEPAHAAALNARIMLGQPRSGLWPGHTYLMTEVYQFLAWRERELEEFHADLVRDLIDPPTMSQGQNEQKHLEKLEAYTTAAKSCVPVVLEVSPACDLYQDKLHVGRLVAGIIIPYDLTVKRAPLALSGQPPARKVLGPLIVDSLGGQPMSLVLNSRYVSGCDPSSFSAIDPIARLRDVPLADVQAWVTGQGGRVGMMQVRP